MTKFISQSNICILPYYFLYYCWLFTFLFHIVYVVYAFCSFSSYFEEIAEEGFEFEIRFCAIRLTVDKVLRCGVKSSEELIESILEVMLGELRDRRIGN